MRLKPERQYNFAIIPESKVNNVLLRSILKIEAKVSIIFNNYALKYQRPLNPIYSGMI